MKRASTKPKKTTCNLYIRDFPIELHRRMKVLALNKGLTLKEAVVAGFRLLLPK